MTKSKTLFTLITSLFLFVLSFVSLPVYGSTPTEQVILTRQEYNELLMKFRNAQQYNQRAVEDNRRVRTAIERSTDVNERIETRINRIDELNQRTEGAITNSQEHIRAARENAINAKRIIGEGERILRNADERTQKNQDATKEQ